MTEYTRESSRDTLKRVRKEILDILKRNHIKMYVRDDTLSYFLELHMWDLDRAHYQIDLLEHEYHI